MSKNFVWNVDSICYVWFVEMDLFFGTFFEKLFEQFRPETAIEINVSRPNGTEEVDPVKIDVRTRGGLLSNLSSISDRPVYGPVNYPSTDVFAT